MIVSWKATGTSSEGNFSRNGIRNIDTGELHIKTDVPKGHITSATATIPLKMQKDERLFMNGYQTWTYCPEYKKNSYIRGIRYLPKVIVNTFQLDRYGDYHFVDYPSKRGITHGFSWCYFRLGNRYRLIASLDETTGYTMFRYDANQEVLTIEKDLSGIACENEYSIFDLIVLEGNEEEVFDAWFEALQVKPLTTNKICGYSSWYNRYQDISSLTIAQDLEGCQKVFEEGDLFQIDDGWEPFVGDWLEADSTKFPEGMKKEADKIHAAGFKAGLWLAPFVAETKSKIYQEHPDWFYLVDGQPWSLGSNWSGFYSLNIDHPEVIEYLKEVFHRVFDEWGFDLVKLDFLYGAAPFGNEKETRAGRMYRAMHLLRELCGDKEILGCGVPVMPAFGLVEYCRISCDVTLDYNDVLSHRIIHRERPSTKQAIGNILSRRQLNGRAYISDPDVFFLREENCKLTEKQKVDLAVLDALLGGVWLTSDDLSQYTPEKIAQYKRLRNLTKATNVHYHPIKQNITYELDGKEEIFELK